MISGSPWPGIGPTVKDLVVGSGIAAGRARRPSFPKHVRHWYFRLVSTDSREMAEALRQLIDEYRERCLWFLRPDYYPEGLEETLRTFDYIERHGDQQAYRRSAEIRRWLSRRSSAPSAAS